MGKGKAKRSGGGSDAPKQRPFNSKRVDVSKAKTKEDADDAVLEAAAASAMKSVLDKLRSTQWDEVEQGCMDVANLALSMNVPQEAADGDDAAAAASPVEFKHRILDVGIHGRLMELLLLSPEGLTAGTVADAPPSEDDEEDADDEEATDRTSKKYGGRHRRDTVGQPETPSAPAAAFVPLTTWFNRHYLSVRSAAAAALRNILLVAGAEDSERLFKQPVDAVRCSAVVEAMPVSSRPPVLPPSVADLFVAVLGGVIACVEIKWGELLAAKAAGSTEQPGFWTPLCNLAKELLDLATLAADAVEAVAVALLPTLPVLIKIITGTEDSTSGLQNLQIGAAELLAVLAEDSPAVSQYLDSMLSPEAAGKLMSMVSTAPMSPSLLRLGVTLCVVVLRSKPTSASVTLVLPLLAFAVSMCPPMTSASQAAALLAASPDADAILDETVRRAGFDQNIDRLMAYNGAVNALTMVLDIVAALSDPRIEDEEVAFCKHNPLAPALLAVPAPANAAAQTAPLNLVSLMAHRAAELMVPVQDPILAAALAPENCNLSGDLSLLTSLINNGRALTLGLTASLVILVPVTEFGAIDVMWNVVLRRVSTVVNELNAAVASASPLDDAPESSPMNATQMENRLMQMESLMQIAWTLLRKDASQRIVAEAGQVDLMTKAFWVHRCPMECKEAVVGTLGALGCRAINTPGVDPKVAATVHYGCANFLVRVLMAGIKHELDVRAEAANVLMDLFSDERYDSTCYLPLNAHECIKLFYTQLRQGIKFMDKSGGGGVPTTRRSAPANDENAARREHLIEIADNLQAFMKYKQQHAGVK